MKRGFTLIETVVTVGIVAAMAAVVIPQVAKQFDAADPTRVQNDLKNIQTAIETFFVNVKSMPGDIDDLANLIDGGGNTDTSLTVAISALPNYSSSQDELWNGPYVDQSITETDPDDEITTGYGAKIVDNFVCYSTVDDTHGISEATGAGATDDLGCPVAGSVGKFLAIQITGVACATGAGTTFMAINELFDGPSEANPDVNGRIRCDVVAASNKTLTVEVVYFLAVPLG
jgi:prepilin-type N-terminal cleavage/methylation domain-containing protein